MRSILFHPTFFLFLAACGAPSGPEAGSLFGDPSSAVEIEVGECEGSSLRSASQDTGGATSEPSVSAEVAPEGSLVVHLEDVGANCCPSPGATFSTEEGLVTLEVEDVTASTSCDCGCILDFTITSEPFAPGDYLLEVVYHGEVFGPLTVVVP